MIIKEKMWLTSIKSIEKKGQTETTVLVTIDGIALDEKTVADFMSRLQKSDRFSNVLLQTVRNKAFEGKNVTLKSFQITCNKQPLTLPEEPEKEEEKGKS